MRRPWHVWVQVRFQGPSMCSEAYLNEWILPSLEFQGWKGAEVWAYSHKTCIFKNVTRDCITFWKIEAQSWHICGIGGLGAAEWVHLWHVYPGNLAARLWQTLSLQAKDTSKKKKKIHQRIEMVQLFLVLVSPFASQHGLIHGNSMPLKTNFSLINFFFFW